MTILGIDYGTRWLGLALGQTETRFAFPYRTLEQGEFLFSQLTEICRAEKVEKIVVGVPSIWNGGGAIQNEIKKFGGRLRIRLNLSVVFAEELFTSRFARVLAPTHARHTNHAQAAALIVENYFS